MVIFDDILKFIMILKVLVTSEDCPKYSKIKSCEMIFYYIVNQIYANKNLYYILSDKLGLDRYEKPQK